MARRTQRWAQASALSASIALVLVGAAPALQEVRSAVDRAPGAVIEARELYGDVLLPARRIATPGPHPASVFTLATLGGATLVALSVVLLSRRATTVAWRPLPVGGWRGNRDPPRLRVV